VAEPTPILLPKAGMNMVEATVVAWHRSPGDRVEAGEPVVDVETDKVELQVEAPVAGVLREILVGIDEDAQVGATLGLIEPSE
jgi:pyruvate/2-oxoglutarate dehydrogenase complex dihydrolipoamide acyltransferase (E2) component